MNDPFAIGDVVELKSLSPRLTVEKCSDGTVYCVWFEGAEVKRGHFPANALKRVPNP